MINVEYLKNVLIISILLSTITCTFIQKTKEILISSKYIPIYSLFVNIILGIFFATAYTNIEFPNSIWIGILSFVGADSIYKSLKGKLLSYTELRNNKK